MGQPKRKQSKRLRPHRVNPATGTYRGRKVVEVDL